MGVNIEWVGHACFRIWREGGPVIVTDPFSPTRLGLPAGPAIHGDMAIVSSLDDLAHGDPGLIHGSPEVINALDLVRDNRRVEVDGNPLVPLGAAESPLHDSGSPKDNALYAFKVEDLWILHLGDLGYGPSPAELSVFEASAMSCWPSPARPTRLLWKNCRASSSNCGRGGSSPCTTCCGGPAGCAP